jgi:hypothetical protein
VVGINDLDAQIFGIHSPLVSVRVAHCKLIKPAERKSTGDSGCTSWPVRAAQLFPDRNLRSSAGCSRPFTLELWREEPVCVPKTPSGLIS